MKKALILIILPIVIMTGFVSLVFLSKNLSPFFSSDKSSNITAFYQLTREDPLFTSPLFDISGYENALKLLKKNNENFENASGRKEKIFPFIFLESLPAVFKNEDKFLKNPSLSNALSLVNAYNTTALAYKSEADYFYKTLKEHQNLIGKLRFVFVDTYTTTKVLLSDVEKIKKNGEALVEEVNLRKKCLENIKFCKKPSQSWNMPKLKTTSFQLDLLPKDVLLPILSVEELKKVRGPYAVFSPCWGWGGKFCFTLTPFLHISQNKTLPERGNFCSQISEYKLLSQTFK